MVDYGFEGLPARPGGPRGAFCLLSKSASSQVAEHASICSVHLSRQRLFLQLCVQLLRRSEHLLMQSSAPLPPAAADTPSKRTRVMSQRICSKPSPMKWILLALLALMPMGALAQEIKPFPEVENPPEEKEPVQKDESKERVRGKADPCQLDCSKTTMSCAQSCNSPKVDREDPQFKDKKKVRARKPTDADKCVMKCGETQNKCLAACK